MMEIKPCPFCGNEFPTIMYLRSMDYWQIHCPVCDIRFRLGAGEKERIKERIFGMAVKVDYALPDDYDFLVQFEQPKPITNADRILAMTDEELAFEMTAKGGCPHDCEEPENMDTDCVKCWLDWLRKEINDGKEEKEENQPAK